jgi:isoquinoline 1-oxidoreductase beta subunit
MKALRVGPLPQAVDVGRRRALKLGGLTIAFLWTATSGTASAAINARRQPGDAAAAAADGNPPFAPNAFIRIDVDGLVRLVMPNVEMGQGIYTGACMMLAEELNVGIDQIKVEHAPPNEELYSMPLLGGQITGGSTSTRGHWEVLREAGAVARTMMVTAAAQRWHVDPSTCSVARGHAPGIRPHLGLRRAGQVGGRVTRSAQGCAQGIEEFHADRQAAAARRFRRQGVRHDAVRHRRAGAGDEDRDGQGLSDVRRQAGRHRR